MIRTLKKIGTWSLAVVVLLSAVLVVNYVTRGIPLAFAASVSNYFLPPAGAGKDNFLILDGTWKVDSTSVTATGAELNTVDVATPGTAQSAKALVLSSSMSATGVLQFGAGNLLLAINTKSASGDISTAELHAYQVYSVSTSGGAVDLDFGEDVALSAADIGQTWRFVITAGTNALTVTAGTTVSTLTTIATAGSACEDVGDYIDVVPYTTTAAKAYSYCAD